MLVVECGVSRGIRSVSRRAALMGWGGDVYGGNGVAITWKKDGWDLECRELARFLCLTWRCVVPHFKPF